MICGIDFGSKLAGTTVISWLDSEGRICFQASEKNRDADVFLSSFFKAHELTIVAIDAPLSLPQAYYGQGDDFFYRECDRELSAMSPMFLGGLTARAIRLVSTVIGTSARVIESYPKALSADIPDYKKSKGEFYLHTSEIKALQVIPPQEVKLKNWHHLDSLLALSVARRFKQGQAKAVGLDVEGIIWL